MSSAEFEFEPSLEAILEHIALLTAELPDGVPAPTIVIDGPSGAGKTTMAELVAQHWLGGSASVFHLDDVYPGWSGLQEGSDVAQTLLRERAAGKPAHWQRYDWFSGQHAEWHMLDPLRPLIVEGCGALTSASVDASQARLWVSAPDDLRKHRALSRGGEDFERHWSDWDEQFAQFVRRASPVDFATISVAATR